MFVLTRDPVHRHPLASHDPLSDDHLSLCEVTFDTRDGSGLIVDPIYVA